MISLVHLIKWYPFSCMQFFGSKESKTFIKISNCFDIYWRATQFRCITRNSLVLWYFGSIYFSRKANNNRRQSKINLAFLCVSAPDSVAWKVQFHILPPPCLIFLLVLVSYFSFFLFQFVKFPAWEHPCSPGWCMSKGMRAFNYRVSLKKRSLRDWHPRCSIRPQDGP